MIPESFIQDLLHRVDIVDVVERHVKLKRAGANYAACCPFHSEKTPSFTVSPTKQFYHCFGCGAHGTAIGFLMEYGGMGFVDAVKDLAHQVGMTVPEIRSEAAERAALAGEDLHAVLLQAARFYRAQLKDAPNAIAYLKQRGLSGEIAKRFGIGYAPDAWQALAGAFSDYAAKALPAAGLVKENDEGKRYDIFRNRIMFPIVDVRGNVIGFGGRVLDSGTPAAGGKSADGPKYLNSPETPVFEKGRELYGLYQARRAIREAGRAIVVEGYMDVVALAQHGIEYAVATLGTATTPLHVQKLLRQTEEIVFCFDGDDAGRRAAWRALENSLSQLVDGKQVGFLFLPQGEDPDTYVRKHGKTQFEALLHQALPLSRYFLDSLSQRFDLSAAEGRAGLIHAARPLMKTMPPTTFRMQIVNELARRARLTPQEVEAQCELPSGSLKKRAASPAPSARPAPPAACKRLLRILVNAPSLAKSITAERRGFLKTNADLLPVIALLDAIETSGATSTGGLTEAVRGSSYASLYEEAARDALIGTVSDDTAAAELEGELLRLEKQHVEKEYQELSNRKLNTDAERQRFVDVSRRLAELKGAAAV